MRSIKSSRATLESGIKKTQAGKSVKLDEFIAPTVIVRKSEKAKGNKIQKARVGV